MSRTSSTSSGAPAEKPRANLYTVLLVIALLAMIVGTIFMYYESTADSRGSLGLAAPGAAATVAHAGATVAAPALGGVV